MVRTFKQFFVLLIFVLGAALPLNAQNQEATLTVFGDGTNKEEAIKVALRSAIEQAFGVFVSSNTKVINDDVVKDEIATVSSGNVKHFDVISEDYRDGKCFVSVSAIVSVGKLINYCKQQGLASEATIDAESFLMNQKINELNEKNRKLALQHKQDMKLKIYEDIYNGSANFFDYELHVSEPQVVLWVGELDCNKIYTDENFKYTRKDGVQCILKSPFKYYRLKCRVHIKLNQDNFGKFKQSLTKLEDSYKGIIDFEALGYDPSEQQQLQSMINTNPEAFENITKTDILLKIEDIGYGGKRKYNYDVANNVLSAMYNFEISDGIHEYSVKPHNLQDFIKNLDLKNYRGNYDTNFAIVDGKEDLRKCQMWGLDNDLFNSYDHIFGMFAKFFSDTSDVEYANEADVFVYLFYSEDEFKQIKNVKLTPKMRTLKDSDDKNSTL